MCARVRVGGATVREGQAGATSSRAALTAVGGRRRRREEVSWLCDMGGADISRVPSEAKQEAATLLAAEARSRGRPSFSSSSHERLPRSLGEYIHFCYICLSRRNPWMLCFRSRRGGMGLTQVLFSSSSRRKRIFYFTFSCPPSAAVIERGPRAINSSAEKSYSPPLGKHAEPRLTAPVGPRRSHTADAWH